MGSLANRSAAPKLRREMSGLGGMVITLTALSPSIGVFIAAPVVIQQSGSFVLAACGLAVALGLIMAGVYAELGSAFPHAGGDYVLIGATLGPTFRFANLASGLAGLPIALALSGLGIGDFLKVAAPGIDPLACALGAIVVVTALAALSIRMNVWITGLFLAAEIAALVATAVLGFAHPHNDLMRAVLHPVMAAPGGGLRPTPLLAMGLAGSAAVYALNGYGSAVNFGEEVVGARHKMLWMIYGALGLGALTIVPPLIGVVVGAPSLSRLSASPTPLQDFVVAVGGTRIAAWISVGVALAIFNAMIAVALIGGRILYSAARESAWTPRLNGALSRVHARYGSPWVATFVIGVAGLMLCAVPLSVLVVINGSGAAFSYALLAFGVIAGRRGGATSGSPSKMPLHPLGPGVVILSAVGLLAAALADKDTGRPGVLVTLVLMSAGALYYRLVVRPAGAWSHHDPDAEEAPAPI